MKTVFRLILVLTIFVPMVASAAWWNPFTWGFFHKQFSQEVKVLPESGQQVVVATTTIVNVASPTITVPIQQVDEIEKLKKEIAELKKNQIQQEGITKVAVKSVVVPVVKKEEVQTPAFDPNTCLLIDIEKKEFIKNTSESWNYLLSDLLPIFDDQIDGSSFKSQSDNLSSTRSSFFSMLNNFKQKDIARIKSSYLSPVYVSQIKEYLTSVVSGYKDTWDLFDKNLVYLRNVDVYDGAQKNRAYDLIDQNIASLKQTRSYLDKTRELFMDIEAEYTSARKAYGCY